MRAQLPHSVPIRMVESIERLGNFLWATDIIIPAVTPYVGDDFLCPEMLLECMAQCCGGASEKNAVIGYLAAVKDFIVTGRPRVGERIRVRCQLIAKIGSILVFSGTVDRAENNSFALLARAELKIFLQEDET